MDLLSVWNPSFWHRRWEIPHELSILLHLGPEIDNRKFVVQRNIHPFHLIQGEQGLLASKDLLKEIFVHHILWWNIELKLLLEVPDEVTFGRELAIKFVWHHQPLLRIDPLRGPDLIVLLLVIHQRRFY